MTPPNSTGTLPRGTRLGRTCLRVADRDEITNFYERIVGLAVLSTDESTTVLGVDDAPILVLEADAERPPRAEAETGLFHNAFRVPSRAALADALGRIRDGWRLDGASDHFVSEALYLTDPEGNGVEIYRDFPEPNWPRTEDGRPKIGTEPLDLAALEADAAGGRRVPPGTDLGHVHLEVSSLPDTRAFYVDALGFDRILDLPRATFISAGGYHHHVGANTWNGRTAPARGRGLAWFEILLPDADALEALRARLAEHDVAVAEGDGALEVIDPDGIAVRVRRGE
ncbi:VOC family protein [Haloferacaceae archaeon DSL9]